MLPRTRLGRNRVAPTADCNNSRLSCLSASSFDQPLCEGLNRSKSTSPFNHFKNIRKSRMPWHYEEIMNKNKSHLYALMIHQANSSWLKSLERNPGAKHSYDAAVQKSIKITIFYVIDKINSTRQRDES
jgi:hypothetical protein